MKDITEGTPMTTATTRAEALDRRPSEGEKAAALLEGQISDLLANLEEKHPGAARELKKRLATGLIISL